MFDLSIVVPIYNEAANIPRLVERLMNSLDATKRSYEVVFVNDGSTDNSLHLLLDAHRAAPDRIRVVNLKSNAGQHMAIIAGFSKTTGQTVVTLDADLQNQPEDIERLLHKIDEGHDYVGSYRDKRHDTFFRTYVSRIINYVRERITDIHMRDQGCMLRAYSRSIVTAIVNGGEHATFIPALAYKLSHNPTEVEVRHAERAAGESKYTLYMLVRLNFDLITGFSIVPLQLFTMFGLLTSFLSGILVAYLMIRRFFMGPEAEGVFTLFAIAFFLISVVIVGVGLVGEYVGRLALNLSSRPRYDIQTFYDGSQS
jgi:undecaprenyl-phosphate 4-deoxy-4-formamido-L-arabinose transferase